jgi:hypothetical protein
MLELASYYDLLREEFFEDCAALTRLRSAAARLEWLAANPIEQDDAQRAAA